jgi:hypothetical protein
MPPKEASSLAFPSLPAAGPAIWASLFAFCISDEEFACHTIATKTFRSRFGAHYRPTRKIFTGQRSTMHGNNALPPVLWMKPPYIASLGAQ